MLKIAICDDESIYLKKIERTIASYLTAKQIDFQIRCFESGKQLVEQSKIRMEYDMVFLDVNMEELDGIETARIIRTLSNSVYIVFITAYITYALDGYKVDAVRYLLKEDEQFENSMQECLDVILDKMNYQEERLELEFQNGQIGLRTDRILYIESRLHKLVFFVLEDGIREYSRYDRLDTIQTLLHGKGFCRVHQSFLVNMRYVKTIKRYQAVLTVGAEISVSKKYYKDAERAYLRMRGEV